MIISKAKSLPAPMLRFFFTIFLSLLTGFIAVSFAPSSHAAEAAATGATEINSEEPGSIARFQLIQYKVMPFEDVWIGRASAQLDDLESLPALIEIAVPQNAAVYVLHHEGSDNLLSQAQRRTEGNLDIYQVVINNRIASIEWSLPANPLEISSDGPAMSLAYTPLRDVPELHLVAALPVDSAVVDPEFEYIGSGPEGEPAFGRVIYNATGGTEYLALIPYIENASGRQGIDNTVMAAAIAAGCLIVAIGMFALFKRSTKNNDEDAEE